MTKPNYKRENKRQYLQGHTFTSAKLKQLAEKYDSIEIEYDRHWYDGACCHVYGHRLETDAEYNKRIKGEEKADEMDKKEREAAEKEKQKREKKKLKELMKKYPDLSKESE